MGNGFGLGDIVSVVKTGAEVVNQVSKRKSENNRGDTREESTAANASTSSIAIATDQHVVNVRKNENGDLRYLINAPGLNVEGELMLKKNEDGSLSAVARVAQDNNNVQYIPIKGEIVIPNDNNRICSLGYIEQDPNTQKTSFIVPKDGLYPADATVGIGDKVSKEIQLINLPETVMTQAAVVPKAAKISALTATQATPSASTKQQEQLTAQEATSPKPDATPVTNSPIEKSAKFLASSPDYKALSTDQYKIDLKYATEENFTKKNIYGPLTTAYVNKELFSKLEQANELLQEKLPGAKFVIYDAARPLSAQQALWDAYPDPNFVGKPNPSRAGGHTAGMSIDLGIVDKNGKVLPMGTGFDDFTSKASSSPSVDKALVSKGEITQEASNNRALLRDTMMSAGFTPYIKEWWHFDVVPEGNKEAHNALKATVGVDGEGLKKLYDQNKEYISGTGNYLPIK